MEDVVLQELIDAANESEDIGQVTLVSDFIELLKDGNLDDEAAEVLIQLVPEIESKDASKVIESIRETGVGSYPVSYVRINQPRWSARRLFRDVFMPVNTETIESARWIADRYMLTEVELREKIVSEGWSKKFVTEVLKHKGKSHADYWHESYLSSKFGEQPSFGSAHESDEELFEIYYVFSRDSSSDNIPGIFVQPMSMFVGELAATSKPELLDYDHGLYPFVKFMREDTERGIVQSRGIGEIVQTWQNGVKVQRDGSADYTSLSIIPPRWVSPRRAGVQTIMGPGAEIPRLRADVGLEEFIDIPDNTRNAEQVKAEIMEEHDKYFALDPLDPNETLRYNQALIDDSLSEFQEVLKMTLALMQQFMPEMETSIVTNSNEAPLRMTRDEIQGEWNITVQFDARDLDAEQVEKKMQGYQTAMAMDTDGTLVNSAIVTRFVEWMDPTGASETVQPVAAVKAQEFNDEQNAISMMASGVEPPLIAEGKNASARLQIMSEQIQKNPDLIELYNDETKQFRAMVEARAQMFQHQLDQQKNAQIGITGSEPALDQIQQ